MSESEVAAPRPPPNPLAPPVLHVPRDVINWTKADAKKRGFPVDPVDPVDAPDPKTFSIISPTHLQVSGGETFNWLVNQTTDGEHTGSGYIVGADTLSFQSTGLLCINSLEDLAAIKTVSFSANDGSIYITFANASRVPVAVLTAPWPPTLELKPCAGYYWWDSE